MDVRRLFSIFAILCFASVAFAQGGERGTAEVTIHGKKISITYGRPELKGRDMLSKAPVGTVWRLGMNNATEIDTAADLDVAGTAVKAGKYSLWAKRVSDSEWHLCFHPKTGIWGAPPQTEGYVAELPLKLTTATASVDKMEIDLAEAGGKAKVEIEWGTMVLTGDIGVK